MNSEIANARKLVVIIFLGIAALLAPVFLLFLLVVFLTGRPPSISLLMAFVPEPAVSASPALLSPRSPPLSV
jgi:hypothetical protein